MFFSQHFSFPLSVSFHHCSIVVGGGTYHSSRTNQSRSGHVGGEYRYKYYDLYRGLRVQFLILLMMGAVTPETCRVVLQWINICILLHLLGFYSHWITMHGNTSLKFTWRYHFRSSGKIKLAAIIMSPVRRSDRLCSRQLRHSEGFLLVQLVPVRNKKGIFHDRRPWTHLSADFLCA